MAIVVIGKIQKDNKASIEACRLIDTVSKEMHDLSLERIKLLIKSGVQIKGFVLTEPCENYCIKKKAADKVLKKENTNQFRFSRVPMLRGSGELINTSDNRFLTVYGWKGFAELKEYYLFNYKGETTILSQAEFEDKVRKQEINGASINPKTNKVIISKSLSLEIY